MSERNSTCDYLPAFGSIAAWSIAPALIAFIAGIGFDPYSQTFYRYLSAAAFMLLLALLIDRPGLKVALRRWRSIAPMAVAVAVFQTSWTMAIYVVGPTIAAFAEHSSIVFGIVGGALFFKDERRLVVSWKFWPGMTAVLACAFGVVLGGGTTSSWSGGGRDLLLPLALLFVSAASWAVYALLIKRLVTGSDTRDAIRPLPAFTVAMIGATAITFAIAVIWGDLSHCMRIPAWQAALVFFSGVIGVGVGQALYSVSIRRVGVVVSQTITLATPFFAGLVAFAAVGDHMNAMQWLYGTGLMAGVAYLMSGKMAATSPETVSGTSP